MPDTTVTATPQALNWRVFYYYFINLLALKTTTTTSMQPPHLRGVVYLILFLNINCLVNYYFLIKAAAWAKPSRSQAVSGGFGLA